MVPQQPSRQLLALQVPSLLHLPSSGRTAAAAATITTTTATRLMEGGLAFSQRNPAQRRGLVVFEVLTRLGVHQLNAGAQHGSVVSLCWNSSEAAGGPSEDPEAAVPQRHCDDLDKKSLQDASHAPLPAMHKDFLARYVSNVQPPRILSNITIYMLLEVNEHLKISE